MKNKVEKIKYTIPEITYFIILMVLITKKYIALIFNMVFQKDTIIVDILYMIFLILIMTQIILVGITKKDIILGILTVILVVISGENILIIHLALAIASKYVSDKTVIKYYFMINITLFISILILKNIDVLPESPIIHYRRLSSGELIPRYDFGMGNPNTVFFNLMPIYAAYIYLRFEKYKMIDRIMLLGSAIYIYSRTNSRTGFIVILISIVLVDLFKHINFKKHMIISKVIIYIPWIILIFSILIGTVFSENEIINNLLTGRPGHWNYYLNNMNFIGWGRINSLHPLDNSYIYMLSITGLIVTAMILVFITYCISQSIKENKKLALLTICFLVFGFAENIIFDNSINFTFLILLKRYILKYNDVEIS